ncbi:MAG TPA: carboxypeptidase regulatory-like domain-containing protein, partial [Terriglobia bacterium]|nr:carboxypeptidase regulatory-like domain-containing protein [Terriglobia bacterium]
SKMKDESARDKAIENLLGQKLRGRATAGNGCPDAEIIASYFERTLSQKERSRWEGHFDSCAACQQRIAALVRMDEASEASISSPFTKPAPQPKKRFLLRWAWTAPLLLVVLVAGLWYTGELEPLLNRHSGTEATAPPPAVKPASRQEIATTGSQAPAAATSNVVSPLNSRAATPPAQKPSVASNAKDELKAPLNAPAAPEAASSPPPSAPSPATDIAAEERNKERAAASVSSTGAGAGAAGNAQLRAVPPAEPQASKTGGVVGGVLGKAENEPSPSGPPPQKKGDLFEAQALSGGAGTKKAVQPAPVAQPATQESFGIVRGSVRDASGAAIPGAKVIVTNNNTNVAKEFTANRAGEYSATSLIPGEYTIQASAQGFKTASIESLPLQARADRQLDFLLQVGSTAQTVEVQSQSSTVATEAEVATAAQAPATSDSAQKETSATRGIEGPQNKKQENIPKASGFANLLAKFKGDRRAPGFHYAEAPVTAEGESTRTSMFWRVGPKGLIQKLDANENWVSVPSGVSADLLDVSFPSSQVGWAVGREGTVVRSANGGETWGRLASPTGEDLVSVRATSDEAAEILTRSGVEFITTDGATTWIRTGKAR